MVGFSLQTNTALSTINPRERFPISPGPQYLTNLGETSKCEAQAYKIFPSQAFIVNIPDFFILLEENSMPPCTSLNTLHFKFI